MARSDLSAKTAGGEDGYLAGQLLIAMPGMQDPRFARSIICICAHSADGAMGLVLNKPLAGLSFDALLNQLGLAPVTAQRQIKLCQGGPVEGGHGGARAPVDAAPRARAAAGGRHLCAPYCNRIP
jgi:putative AlgH/UPF0301 family transcriptional regulator